MNTEELKALTKSVKELSKDHIEMGQSIKTATRDADTTKKLWKSQNKPWLIRTGIALIVLPEPFVTVAVGTAFVAAGAVQEGIKRQAVYVDDLPKAFNSVMKDLKNTKSLF